MKPSVYLETSFISYLTGPVSQNVITAAPLECNKDYCTTVRNNPYCAPEAPIALNFWSAIRIIAPFANAQLQSRLRQISQQRGYELPILCTPYELL